MNRRRRRHATPPSLTPDRARAAARAAAAYAARRPARQLVALGRLETLELDDGTRLDFRGARRPLLVRDERGWLRALPAKFADVCERAADVSGAAPPGMLPFYRALHEGRPARCVAKIPTPRAPAPAQLAPRARLAAIVYAKETTEPGAPPLYRHPYAPHARPWVALDPQGLPHFLGGRLHVTTRGITDMNRSSSNRRSAHRRGARRNPVGAAGASGALRANESYIANPTAAPAAPNPWEKHRANPSRGGSSGRSGGVAAARAGTGANEPGARRLVENTTKALAAAGGSQLVGGLLLGLTPLSDPARHAVLGAAQLVGSLFAYRWDKTTSVALAGGSMVNLIAGALYTPEAQQAVRRLQAALSGGPESAAAASTTAPPPASAAAPAGLVAPAGQPLSQTPGVSTLASCGR